MRFRNGNGGGGRGRGGGGRGTSASMCERGDDAAATEEAMATEGAVETREVPADGVDSAERAEDDEGRGNGTETSEGAGATDPESRASTAVTAVRKITAWIGKDDAGAKGRQRGQRWRRVEEDWVSDVCTSGNASSKAEARKGVGCDGWNACP